MIQRTTVYNVLDQLALWPFFFKIELLHQFIGLAL